MIGLCSRSVALASALAPFLFAVLTLGQGIIRTEEADPDAAVVTPAPNAFVAKLNKRTFSGNVLKGELVRDWFVFFCVDWYPPCEVLRESYDVLGQVHHTAINDGMLLRSKVRFAQVDCAVDKVLCNEQSVEMYPTVNHYHAGNLTAAWTGDGKNDGSRLTKWLSKQLPGDSEPAPLLTQAERRAILRVLGGCAALLAMFIWSIGRGADFWELWRSQRAQPSKVKEGVAEPAQPEGHLVRRLPREWWVERGSLEL